MNIDATSLFRSHSEVDATIGSAIAWRSLEYLDAPPTLVAAADTPVPFAPNLEAAHLPTTEKLVAAIRRLLEY